jgi:hypothetical protein
MPHPAFGHSTGLRAQSIAMWACMSPTVTSSPQPCTQFPCRFVTLAEDGASTPFSTAAFVFVPFLEEDEEEEEDDDASFSVASVAFLLAPLLEADADADADAADDSFSLSVASVAFLFAPRLADDDDDASFPGEVALIGAGLRGGEEQTAAL